MTDTTPDAGDGTDDLRAELVAALRLAAQTRPEDLDLSEHEQWYVDFNCVDCDAETLYAVLAHGLAAAGWRPPLPAGELLDRYVAVSLETDYTIDADLSDGYDNDAEEHEAAIANIVEMHRLLVLRQERLLDAHEEIAHYVEVPLDSLARFSAPGTGEA